MPFATSPCMSKQNNVNPGSYTTGGREHTEGSDKGVPYTGEKSKMDERASELKGKEGEQNPIPSDPKEKHRQQ